MLASARDFRGEGPNRLWRIPLIGSADTDAALYSDDPTLTYPDFPRFSPDGRWLAFRSEYALAVMDTSAGTWSLLDASALGNSPPVWSPTGFQGEMTCSSTG
jgi:hypothetical protein